MQKEYAIRFYETINKLLCNLYFAGQYIWFRRQTPTAQGNALRLASVHKYENTEIFLLLADCITHISIIF